jgi:YbgC/YbaW family acyl-CoA thioester hydrolase
MLDCADEVVSVMSSNPAPVFRTSRRIEFADTDMAGIVHFANFFRFMEAAEVEFLRSRGLSVVMHYEGQEISFPRVAASCDYLRPIRFEDVVEITVSVQRLGSKSITYAFEFFHRTELVARGQISSVCCLVTAGREIQSVEIPAALRGRLFPSQ